MNTNFAYNKAEILQVVEYGWLYPEATVYPTITSLLENIPRDYIVKTVILIINKYNNASFEEMQKFFSSNSKVLHEDFNRRFLNKRNPGVEYVFTTAQTPLELLRQAFSVSYSPKKMTVAEYEGRLLMAILLINEKLHVHNSTIADKDKRIEACNAVLANSFSQKGFNTADYDTTFRVAFTKSIDFFKYTSKNPYFNPIYRYFISELNIASYHEYTTTILGVFIIMFNNAKRTLEENGIEMWMGDFEYKKEKIQDKLISPKVLDALSIDIDDVIPLNKNEDYVAFRGKPLIKNKEGTYAVYNLIFLIERLFNSLYFDFKYIAEEKLNLKRFDEEYKERFFEETLLHKYINLINSHGRYNVLNGAQADSMEKISAPDYYLKNKENSNIILFEHKDIRIGGKVKQSRDLEIIVKEYKNKMLLVTENQGKKVSKPKPIGIGQLVSLIEKIRYQTFVWDKTLDKDAIIYPVLVLTDSNFIPDGLPYLMNTWLYDDLKARGIDAGRVKPLIVMEVSTFLLYRSEFKEKGLEHYFEKYYDVIEKAEVNDLKNPYLSIFNMCVSFSDYIAEVTPKNINEIFENYKKKLFLDYED